MQLHRHSGRQLTDEQIAVAAVLGQAIRNYSEDAFCAGWMTGIEHDLRERVMARPADAYERAVDQLYAAANQERHDWGQPAEPFLAGLKHLAERFRVWVYYGPDGETAIHLDDWKLLHDSWHQRHVEKRPTLEKVWERIHRPFPHLRSVEPVELPPMPPRSFDCQPNVHE